MYSKDTIKTRMTLKEQFYQIIKAVAICMPSLNINPKLFNAKYC